MIEGSSPLRVAIVGGGRIGSAFAFRLAKQGGHEVTVIARPGSLRLEQLQRDGAIVDVSGERAEVRVAGQIAETTAYDVVIVTLMAHQIEAVLPALRRSASPCVLLMFNTFEPERWAAAIGPDRCAFGMPFVQSNLDPDGKLRVAVGAGGQKTLLSEQRWADVFNAAGLPARLEPRMPLWLRCHAPFCVAFESVCVAGERRGGGASWGDAVRLSRGVHASLALVRSLGYPIYPLAKKRIDSSPAWVMATVLWSMSRVRSFRELLSTGEMECRALADVMATAATAALRPRIIAMKPL